MLEKTALKTFKDQYVLCKGINTRYWKAGKGKHAVVLIHGIGGCIEFWQSQVEALSKYFTVYALDMVGFGLTDKPDAPYGYRYFTRFLADFFKASGIKKASLIGHSLGGGICLQFTVYYPEMVEKLVLVSSGGLSRRFTLALRILTLPVIGEILMNISMKNPRSIIESLFYDTSRVRKEWIDVIYRINKLPNTQKAFLDTLRNNATVFNGTKKSISGIINHLNTINAKTLVIWGKQDDVIPFYVSGIAVRNIKNAALWAIDKCGHAPHFDYPDEFNKRVGEFLLESK